MVISSTSTVAEIISNAQLFNPKTWDIGSQFNLHQLLEAIESLFAQLDRNSIPYLLIGGIAMLTYVEGRNTDDIDLIMGRSDLNKLKQMIIAEENKDFVRADYRGLQVDLLLTRNTLFELVRQNHGTDVRWGNCLIRCATPLGLVILKLYALPSLYKQNNFHRAALYETDILQLTYNYGLQLKSALETVEPYLTVRDRANLRLLAQDIQNRHQRMIRAQTGSINK